MSEFTPKAAMIAVHHLHKSVETEAQSLTILHDINFSVPVGASLAIVGRSGSGKSSLLALLAGLDLPTQGEVLLQGQALQLLDEDGRARVRGQLAGFVFQSFQLLPELTALENVMLPLELIGDVDAEARALKWLERVGLKHRLNHLPRQLSGGEQQRVALARAFAPKPAVLFADEPTGSLDTATGAVIADLLFELNREMGATLVLVTHDEMLAARCSHRLRLQGGEVIEWLAPTTEEAR
ncbi:ATP-binding cassette domain-containing protein [Chitinibacter bivalviorum]|uniref:ATP-binding cassette domain-containing protein n=1 Tax=Chitinibacter bivalviorum TaxID=2739434 RepID=A0A7H9BLM6_9NEIS|nr:ATP-binding cassette domain-containing protein [Chitinibacter bivalviorum]QLG88324.1 ATP-binding cassette domain-containing protein [Chitinibacter bivalviorum]